MCRSLHTNNMIGSCSRPIIYIADGLLDLDREACLSRHYTLTTPIEHTKRLKIVFSGRRNDRIIYKIVHKSCCNGSLITVANAESIVISPSSAVACRMALVRSPQRAHKDDNVYITTMPCLSQPTSFCSTPLHHLQTIDHG